MASCCGYAIANRIPSYHGVHRRAPSCTSLRVQTIGLQRATFSDVSADVNPDICILLSSHPPKRARAKEVTVLRKPRAIPVPYVSRRSGTQTASRCSCNQRWCFPAYLSLRETLSGCDDFLRSRIKDRSTESDDPSGWFCEGGITVALVANNKCFVKERDTFESSSRVELFMVLRRMRWRFKKTLCSVAVFQGPRSLLICHIQSFVCATEYVSFAARVLY